MDQREYEECEVCHRRSWDHDIARELTAVPWRKGFKYYCAAHLPKLRTEDLRIRENKGKAPRPLLD